ncbi:MAG: hypothetical protein JWP52_4447, partial [Rhizobacter sp.]|nr:hypothetical protein [Rhizobacter sp.]
MAEFRVRKLDHEAADSPITPDADLARHGHTPTIDGMEQPDMVDVRPDKKPGGYFRSGGKGNLFSLIGSGALGLAVAGALMPLGIAMPPLFAVAGLGGFAAFVISRGGSWTLPKWIS